MLIKHFFGLILTIRCYNYPTLFCSRFNALKRLVFFLKIIRNAAMAYSQSLLKKTIIHFLQTCSEGERGQRHCGMLLDSL